MIRHTIFIALLVSVIQPARAQTVPVDLQADAVLATTESPVSRQDKIKKAKEYHSIGEQYLKEGNFTLADEAFKKAQDLLAVPGTEAMADVSQPSSMIEPPEASLPPEKKAWELARQGKSKEAISLYQEAIQDDPKNAALYYNIGVEFLKTGEFSRALESFKKVIQLNPRDPEAYYNLAVLYEDHVGNKKQAVEYYRKYVALAKNAEDVQKVNKWIQEICNITGLK